MKIKLLVLACCAMILSSCAVYKAAQNQGVSVNSIKNCTTQMCFLSQGMQVISQRQEKNGNVVEIYRAPVKKTGLNYVRAAGHGALDVATLGLWEVAGTPIESAISNNRGFVVAKATYKNKSLSQMIGVEIYDPKGKRVK